MTTSKSEADLVQVQENDNSELDKEVKFGRELDWCIQKLNSKLINEKDSKKGGQKY